MEGEEKEEGGRVREGWFNEGYWVGCVRPVGEAQEELLSNTIRWMDVDVAWLLDVVGFLSLWRWLLAFGLAPPSRQCFCLMIPRSGPTLT